MDGRRILLCGHVNGKVASSITMM